MKKSICILLSAFLTLSALPLNTFANDKIIANEYKNGTNYVTVEKSVEENMSDREKAAVEKFNELYKNGKIPENIAESELYDIVNNLVYGELYQQGQLTDKDREMISLAALTTETVYHCAPYVGAAKSLEAINVVNDVFKEKGIKIPESQATVTEESRFDDGSSAQTKLFGNLGDTKPADGEVRLGRSFLPDYCFGDFYTRKGLTLEQHELLTWVCIATLGGAESQLTGHTNGNKNVGKSKDYMLEVLTDIMPYIGYPRTLNALNIINTVYDDSNK